MSVETIPAPSGGVTDHGALTGLSDDDHSQYHNDTRGDARYALTAKGVTNGDSHDHSGGDGAQIAYSSLSGAPTLYNQTVEDEGTPVTQRATMNFVGAGVSVADTGSKTTVTIAGGGGLADADYGDITVSGSGATWTIDADAVTYSKIQDVSATDKLLGRATAGAGIIEEIPLTAAGRNLIDDATAADQRTTLGLGTLATQSGTFSGTSSGTNTGDQTSIVGITGSLAEFNAALTGADFATGGGTATGTNTGDQDLSSYATTAAVASGYQPLDAQLTSLAALSFVGNGSKYVRINAGATDFEVVTLAGGGDVVGDDTSTTAQNIVAYTDTGGKNITELTGTQGDVLYHNGTNWAKLGAGTSGRFLRTYGAGANPAWWPDAIYNQSVADQGAGFSTDTYVTGSNILIPSGALKIGTRYYCMFRATKTNAGTATPILNIRFGTNASTADTSRGTLTWTAGTAAVDDSVWEIWTTFLTVGSGTTATIRTVGRITHKLSVTGFTGTAAVSESEVATSGGFDSTVANSYLGISVNGGTSASWTVQMCQSEMNNLA